MQDSEDRQYQNEADIYKRIKLLGSGSYGRAYLVQQKLTGSQCVIKQINLADMSPDEQESALKEAKILQMLQHSNIVHFKEVYRTAKMKLNIVMEYAAGGDLSQRIKAAKESKMHFSQNQILAWFVQICLAVRYIHSNKIIHRDLKAQNVFLTQEGLVKLGDFGVARVMEHTAAKARTVVGSPYYISPQIIENRPYSFKTDIWSLGALLYEMCALQPPFKANNLQFLALKIVQGAPPPLPKMYSQDLRMLVRSLLQTKESNRPSISHIFSNKIVINAIEKMNSGPQIKSQLKNKPSAHTISDFKKMSTLKPPPNLLDFDTNQNKSDIIQSSKREDQMVQPLKPQTPQVNQKKGPNNFNYRPATGRKKIMTHVSQTQLNGIMQIKPSLIEKHQKFQKPLVPLPPVPKKISPTSKVVSPQNQQAILQIKKIEKKDVSSLPSTAFTKKRSSFAQGSAQPKNALKVQEIKVGKAQSKRKQKAELKKQKGTKKPQIRKKTYGISKKQSGQIKLQVCSEEAKKSQIVQKKLEKKKSQKVIKRVEKRKQPRILIRKDQQQAEQGAIMEQEKCNSELTSNNESDDYYTSYEDQQFQEYWDGSDEEEDDLTFSVTGTLNNNYHKMLCELNQIRNNVEAGQDLDQMMKESIPELLNFSAQIREDDSQLDSNQTSKLIAKDSEVQKIDLRCLETQQQLQVLRMKLQDIFGDDNLIYVYNIIEKQLSEQGLNFSEQVVIQQIMTSKKGVDAQNLHRYFGHIVAIISKQKNFL